MKRALISIALSLSAAFAGAAYAQLITNGNFEAGLSGWTVNTTGPCCAWAAIANGGLAPLSFQPTALLAGGGNFVAVSGQNGIGGVSLSQAFTVLPGTTNEILSFNWFDNNHLSSPVGGAGFTGTALDGSTQTNRIDILLGGNVVTNLLLNQGAYNPVNTTTPWLQYNTTLALAPGTYELRFGNGICCALQEFGVDNVSLRAVAGVVPEPESYALMLAGLGLLGFVARYRKQKAA